MAIDRRIRSVNGVPSRPHNVELSENTLAALRARAWDLSKSGKQIGISTLIRDVVEMWLAESTNWEDPMFQRPPMIIIPVLRPIERYPGYLRDLGFDE